MMYSLLAVSVRAEPCCVLQVKDRKGMLNTLYDDLISRELQKRMKEAEGTSSKEMERYRNEMEEERERAGRRSKKISKEQELLVSLLHELIMSGWVPAGVTGAPYAVIVAGATQRLARFYHKFDGTAQ